MPGERKGLHDLERAATLNTLVNVKYSVTRVQFHRVRNKRANPLLGCCSDIVANDVKWRERKAERTCTEIALSGKNETTTESTMVVGRAGFGCLPQ